MFTCISLELQVRTGSNLETRYRYHPQSQSYQKIFFQCKYSVLPAIMGHNGRVVLAKLCLEQIWHIFFTHCLQFITHLRFGPNFTVQPSAVLWYKVSPHKCQLKLGFSLFSDVQKCLEHIYPIILESWSQI